MSNSLTINFRRMVAGLFVVLLGLMIGCSSSVRIAEKSKPTGARRPVDVLIPPTPARAFPLSISGASITPLQLELISQARSWLGTRYKWGGTAKTGADCSGFLTEVFSDLRKKYAKQIPLLPRSSKDLAFAGIAVSEVEVGDVLCFNTGGGGITHVGIFIGNRSMIHCSSSKGVVIQSIDDSYYSTSCVGARRVITIGAIAEH